MSQIYPLFENYREKPDCDNMIHAINNWKLYSPGNIDTSFMEAIRLSMFVTHVLYRDTEDGTIANDEYTTLSYLYKVLNAVIREYVRESKNPMDINKIKEYTDHQFETVYKKGYNDGPYCLARLETTIERIIREYGASVSFNRIENNHDILCKRFGLNAIVNRLYQLDKRDWKGILNYNIAVFCYYICSLLDTYRIDPDKKASLISEEIIYLLISNNIYTEESIIDVITDIYGSVIIYIVNKYHDDVDCEDCVKEMSKSLYLSKICSTDVIKNKDNNILELCKLYKYIEKYNNMKDIVKAIAPEYKEFSYDYVTIFGKTLSLVFTYIIFYSNAGIKGVKEALIELAKYGKDLILPNVMNSITMLKIYRTMIQLYNNGNKDLVHETGEQIQAAIGVLDYIFERRVMLKMGNDDTEKAIYKDKVEEMDYRESASVLLEAVSDIPEVKSITEEMIAKNTEFIPYLEYYAKKYPGMVNILDIRRMVMNIRNGIEINNEDGTYNIDNLNHKAKLTSYLESMKDPMEEYVVEDSMEGAYSSIELMKEETELYNDIASFCEINYGVDDYDDDYDDSEYNEIKDKSKEENLEKEREEKKKSLMDRINSTLDNIDTKYQNLKTKFNTNTPKVVDAITATLTLGDEEKNRELRSRVFPRLRTLLTIVLGGSLIISHPILVLIYLLVKHGSSPKTSAKTREIIKDELESELQVISRKLNEVQNSKEYAKEKKLLMLQKQYKRQLAKLEAHIHESVIAERELKNV